MNYALARTPAFVRATRRIVRQNPSLALALAETLKRLSENPFHPLLHTHKLKGRLKNSWSCSAGYDLRVVFSLPQRNRILLEAVGSHDDVY